MPRLPRRRLRWPHGFVCPTCEGTQAWCTGRWLWMCGSCGHQTSVTAGTLFQDTRTSLETCFRAVWWVVSQKNGAIALGLRRVLGLCSYRTAWTWLHKLRRSDGPGLAGTRCSPSAVEVDETVLSVGLSRVGGAGTSERRHLSSLNAEVHGNVRLRRILECGAWWAPRRSACFRSYRKPVEPGAVVITDGFQSYRGLAQVGYSHDLTSSPRERRVR